MQPLLDCVFESPLQTAIRWGVYQTHSWGLELKQVFVVLHLWGRLAMDVDPMLFYCWAIVCDDGPTLKQH